ncbi:MAG: amidohydrolase [Terriglobales bacterium]
MTARSLLVVLFLAMTLLSVGQNRPAADLIITNGKLYTVDKSRPRAEALAVIGERIVAVGTATDIDQWRGPGTRVIDAREHLVLPGFNDAHTHFMDGGFQLDNVQLKDSDSPQEFARRIGERARHTPEGEWILGGDWDEEKWNPPQLQGKELIDPVTPHTPVLVNRYDGHEVLANSLALKLAGITAQTPDPPGGTILRDGQGNPTGILKDAAMDLAGRKVPPFSHDRLLHAAKRALNYAAVLGVTSVQEMAGIGEDLGDNIRIYGELQERGELTSRIYVVQPLERWQDEAKLGIRHAYGSSRLRIGALKMFADGSLGSRTAYFFQPYTDDPKNRGLLTEGMQPLSKVRSWLMNADDAGLQVCMHAIGDQAISITLDLFGEVQRLHGDGERRWRIEHAQHVAQKDIDRFAALKVIASVQPYHAIDDGRWAERRIGPERIKTTYAFRSLLDHGVRLALGTDWTVAPLNPMLTLYAAVTRATLDGKNPDGWVPEQKITLAEAIEAYTLGSAYAEFQENEKGSLTPGKLADVIILSDDLFAINPKNIPDVKVVTTVVGGRVVWNKE